MITDKGLRAEVESLITQGQWTRAHQRLGELWRGAPKASAASYLTGCYERMREHLPLVKCRISFLRSMTLEPLIPILRSAAFANGIELTVQMGQFNAYAQEMLDPASSLFSFDPDVAVLAVQTRDILPEVWETFADLSQLEIERAGNRVRDEFSTWIGAFRKHSNSSLIVHTLEKPFSSAGVLGAQGKAGQSTAVERLNEALREICSHYRGVYVLDYDALVAQYGRLRWHDESKWLTARMPFAADSLVPMVAEWLKFIHPVTATTCKVLAVDLDNTLWRGVLGEDGIAGIQMGLEYPGACHRALQRAILDIAKRGILVAACSKNDHEEAVAALRNHPDALLRPHHFSAWRINWQDKAQNLREIATELNIGLDAIAFLDDSLIERERVRMALPEVKVIDLPKQSDGFASALRDCPCFERLLLSDEDRVQAQNYQAQQQRAELAANLGSLEDFYRSLDQEVEITTLTPATVARVAQLTQKTNQFNVTTRRYSEQQIEEMASRPGWSIYTVRVKDRFGDNGIVGVLITKTIGDTCEIDTFLLSCRVIGRAIETAVLGFLATTRRAEGVKFLRGEFVPTTKNAPVSGLYSAHQFKLVETRSGRSIWNLDLAEIEVTSPKWMRLLFRGSNLTAEQACA